jgi:hypothetical protein
MDKNVVKNLPFSFYVTVETVDTYIKELEAKNPVLTAKIKEDEKEKNAEIIRKSEAKLRDESKLSPFERVGLQDDINTAKKADYGPLKIESEAIKYLSKEPHHKPVCNYLWKLRDEYKDHSGLQRTIPPSCPNPYKYDEN